MGKNDFERTMTSMFAFLSLSAHWEMIFLAGLLQMPKNGPGPMNTNTVRVLESASAFNELPLRRVLPLRSMLFFCLFQDGLQFHASLDTNPLELRTLKAIIYYCYVC